MGRVQDRVAVVTGAANGLGRAIATRLAEEGARLVLGDIEATGLGDDAPLTAIGAEAVVNFDAIAHDPVPLKGLSNDRNPRSS